jgi:RNA polymerase sigma-70 factor, ECF subfamily
MSLLLATDNPTYPCRPEVALPPLGPAAMVPRVAGKSERELRLRQLVDNHVGHVARILRNAGTAEADIDDDVQRVFIALSNRLDDVRVGAEKSFLIQTALHMAAHARRTAARRREILTDHPPEIVDPIPGPEEIANRRQVRRTLDQLLGQMDMELRVVFSLYEFEQMTTAEISAVLEIPRGTVASRLRRARVDFRDRVSKIESLSKTEVG